jgi:ankyrin repeat protein
MYAAAGGFTSVVDMLIAKGADVNLRHVNGGSALHEAAGTDRADEVRSFQ